MLSRIESGLYRLSIELLLFAGLAGAQNVTATISGIVKDATGAVVPNAAVRATNIGTSASFQTTTNAEGQYAIRTIPVGEYRVEVEAAGFKKYESSGIRLQVDEIARVDPTLTVGGTSESVTVSSEVIPVDTDTILKDIDTPEDYAALLRTNHPS